MSQTQKKMRLDMMRGQAHFRTIQEWMNCFRCSERMVQYYLQELGERARPERDYETLREIGARGGQTLRARSQARRRAMAEEIARYEGTRTVKAWAEHFGCSQTLASSVLADMRGGAPKEETKPPTDDALSMEWLRKPLVCPRLAAELAEAYEVEGLV